MRDRREFPFWFRSFVTQDSAEQVHTTDSDESMDKMLSSYRHDGRRADSPCQKLSTSTSIRVKSIVDRGSIFGSYGQNISVNNRMAIYYLYRLPKHPPPPPKKLEDAEVVYHPCIILYSLIPS